MSSRLGREAGLSLALVARVALGAWLLGASALAAADPIEAIGRGFSESSADLVRKSLARERKVYLDLPCVHPESGFLGADQVYYLFQSFFARNRTSKFKAAPAEPHDTGRLEARADWSYVDRDGETRSLPLLLALTQEEGAWVVVEIRAARS